MTDNDDRRTDAKNPADALAAATAMGVAMASQAMQFWFGVAAGFVRAGQDMLDRQARERGEAAPRPAEAKAAPVRPRPESVKQAAAPQPAPKPTPKTEEPALNVVALKPAVVAEAVTQSADADPAKLATEAPKAAAKAAGAAKPAVRPERAKAAPKPKRAEAAAAPATASPAEKKAPTAPAASIMPEDFRPPRAVSKPAIPDDLKQLPGVGPKLEQVLNSLGVWTYDQVAGWSPEEIAYVEDMTGLNGRITADDWLEQAARLASGATRH